LCYGRDSPLNWAPELRPPSYAAFTGLTPTTLDFPGFREHSGPMMDFPGYQSPPWDPSAQPEPAYEFDQRFAW
jgi:hypothetical protein